MIQRLTETIADVDVSYLSDTVVLVRYFELNREIRWVISVFKQRAGMHECTLTELTLGSRGIGVGSSLVGYHGAMTGVPEILNTASKVKEGDSVATFQ